jgi:hypothetical protein
MHGDRKDAPVPIFGKKSIGVHTGVLDIHGVPKKSWTELDDTVLSGESKITLVEEVDWEAGDEIMITSTSYDMNEAEFATVLDNRVIGGKSEIILESPLKNRHYAGSEQYGDSDVLTMRAEVCLILAMLCIKVIPRPLLHLNTVLISCCTQSKKTLRLAELRTYSSKMSVKLLKWASIQFTSIWSAELLTPTSKTMLSCTVSTEV